MKKKFNSGDVSLEVVDFSTGKVEIKKGKKVLFKSTSPVMLLDVHNVLTQLAVELNKNQKPPEDNRQAKRAKKRADKKKLEKAIKRAKSGRNELK